MTDYIIRFSEMVETKEPAFHGLDVPEVSEARTAMEAKMASAIREYAQKHGLTPQTYATLRSDAYANARWKAEIPIEGAKYVLCSLTYHLRADR